MVPKPKNCEDVAKLDETSSEIQVKLIKEPTLRPTPFEPNAGNFEPIEEPLLFL